MRYAVWVPLIVVAGVGTAWAVARLGQRSSLLLDRPNATRPAVPVVLQAEEPLTQVRQEVLAYRLRQPERIAVVQRALTVAGFAPGPIDGQWGPRTERAVRAFQRAQGLEPTGVVGQRTWDALQPFVQATAGEPRKSGRR